VVIFKQQNSSNGQASKHLGIARFIFNALAVKRKRARAATETRAQAAPAVLAYPVPKWVARPAQLDRAVLNLYANPRICYIPQEWGCHT
jgi:hypothetical protein